MTRKDLCEEIKLLTEDPEQFGYIMECLDLYVENEIKNFRALVVKAVKTWHSEPISTARKQKKE